MNYDMKPIADLMNEVITKLDNLVDPCDNCDLKGLSACCNATINWGDICSDCGEHCGSCCDDCEDSDDTQYQKQKSDESNYLLYPPRI